MSPQPSSTGTLPIVCACAALLAAAAFALLLVFKPPVASRSDDAILGKAAVMQLLNGAPGGALTFEPFQGQRRCCDLGDPTLHLHEDGTVIIDANGFVVEERVARFRVTDDGRLEFLPPDQTVADWLRARDVGRTALLVRRGADVYLVQAGSALPAMPLKKLSQWPFKAARDAR